MHPTKQSHATRELASVFDISEFLNSSPVVVASFYVGEMRFTICAIFLVSMFFFIEVQLIDFFTFFQIKFLPLKISFEVSIFYAFVHL